MKLINQVKTKGKKMTKINLHYIPTNFNIDYKNAVLENTKKYENKTFLVEEYLPPYSKYNKEGEFVYIIDSHHKADFLYQFEGVSTFTKLDVDLSIYKKRSEYPPFVGQEVYLPECRKKEAYLYSKNRDIRLSKIAPPDFISCYTPTTQKCRECTLIDRDNVVI